MKHCSYHGFRRNKPSKKSHPKMNRGPETFCSVLPSVSGRAVTRTGPPKSSPHKPHRVITPRSHQVCKSGVTGEVALNRSLGIMWSLSSFCLIHVLWESHTSPSNWKRSKTASSLSQKAESPQSPHALQGKPKVCYSRKSKGGFYWGTASTRP